MEYSGFAREWDEVIAAGDVGAREFVAFWLRDGRVQAGMNVNVWDVTEGIQELIRSGRQVSRDELASYGSDGASTISSPSSVT
jgi:3-phenylpropionate/trans-cinnamate dioxygenase ferredoxin reductase subunit